MAHRATKRPLVSVLLTVHNNEDMLVRAVESVLGQSFEDVELVIVDCASTDRTRSICERFRERDIRVELISLESDNLSVGMHTAVCAARGRYMLPMRSCDWLGAGLLEQLAPFMQEHDLQLAIPAQSRDTYTGKNRERTSSVTSFDTCVWDTAVEFHKAVGELLMLGVLDDPNGLVVESLLVRAVLPLIAGKKPMDAVIACLERVERAGVLAGASYHVARTDTLPAFDPERYATCEQEHVDLMDLFGSWGFAADDVEMEPLYRRYLLDVIRCIDNASIGRSDVSSTERTQRVQDMIDDETTQQALQALSHAARDFGCMYKPMARKNAVGCCIGSRLREIARVSHIPLTPVL